MAKSKTWIVKPGAADSKSQKAKYLIQNYRDEYFSDLTQDQYMILNDQNDIIYFLEFPDENSEMSGADVAILSGEHYVFIPKDLALQTAHVYLTYIKLISDARTYAREFGA